MPANLPPSLIGYDGEDAPWLDREEDAQAFTCRDCFAEVKEDGDLCPSCAMEEAMYKGERREANP